MSGLVQFYRARLDEDASVALLGGEDVETWSVDGSGGITTVSEYPRVAARCDALDWETQDHIARHDPARVLADVAAKRAIVDAFVEYRDELAGAPGAEMRDVGRMEGLEEAVRHLAAVYADHPDYDQEWTP